MNLLALILGLGVERFLTHFFHWREFRWLDPLFDRAFTALGGRSRNLALLGIGGLALLLVLPVELLELALVDRFAYVPAFVLAVFVLLICLGPRDLVEEVEDYERALAAGDQDAAAGYAAELLEGSAADDPDSGAVERAVYAQANNRIFGVVFWFILLGPSGAWLFRVFDLMRRRANARAAAADTPECAQCAQVVLQLHGLLAWLPSRLLMVGYALAGSYDGGVSAWREYRPRIARANWGLAGELLGAVGCGAATERDSDDPGARARIALELVQRTLWTIWCPILALLTLYDWIM
ncbi:MAG: regulatory signaling modulator protein AmpE [Gammaproteobacteria bacterium]|jgi:membrane protein required for beta-lactamase induction|nr:regulatory signaling modulator protein AmpE [Gammaproteobacteria bacterium]